MTRRFSVLLNSLFPLMEDQRQHCQRCNWVCPPPANHALRPRPRTSVKDREEQTAVSVASAANARLPIATAVRFLRTAKRGMTISDRNATMRPTVLVSGCSASQSFLPDSYRMYAPRRKKLTPTANKARRSACSVLAALAPPISIRNRHKTTIADTLQRGCRVRIRSRQ